MDKKKLVYTRTPDDRLEWRLYDLEKDPGEKTPLLPEQGGTQADRMIRYMEAWLTEHPLSMARPENLDALTEDEVKQLKALGYF